MSLLGLLLKNKQVREWLETRALKLPASTRMNVVNKATTLALPFQVPREVVDQIVAGVEAAIRENAIAELGKV